MEQSSGGTLPDAIGTAARPRIAAGCLYLFALPFCAFGVYALALAIKTLLAGDLPKAAYAGVFALVFCGVGFGLVYGVRRGAQVLSADDRRRAANPDRRWLWREDWAAGRIPASIGTRASVLVGCAVLCFAASTPVVYVIPRELARHNDLILMVLLFPLAGVAMLFQAVSAAARWRVVRGTAFQMDSVPGQVGGTLAGRVVLPAGILPTGEFTLGLRCVNRVTSNTGNSTSNWEHVLWNDEHAAQSDGASVPVAFYVAPETPASDYANARNQIIWRLNAAGPTASGPFNAQFEVPVFKVAETAEQQRAAEVLRASEHRQVESYVHPEASRIAVRQTPGGATEVYFPPLRNPGAALSTVAFTAVWTSIFWLMHVMRVPWVFVAGWGLFDAILVLILLSMLAATRVRVGDGAVTIVKSLAGLVYSRRRIAAGEVTAVQAVAGMTSNNVVYTQLRINYGGNRKFDFADGIRDRREADWLAEQIGRRLGVKG